MTYPSSTSLWIIYTPSRIASLFFAANSSAFSFRNFLKLHRCAGLSFESYNWITFPSYAIPPYTSIHKSGSDAAIIFIFPLTSFSPIHFCSTVPFSSFCQILPDSSIFPSLISNTFPDPLFFIIMYPFSS